MSRRAATLSLAALVLAAVGLGGCYEKVVGAKGFGADHYSIETPDGPSKGPVGTDWIRSTSQVQPRTSVGGPPKGGGGW